MSIWYATVHKPILKELVKPHVKLLCEQMTSKSNLYYSGAFESKREMWKSAEKCELPSMD